MMNSRTRSLVAADGSRRHLQQSKNAPTAVGGYALLAYRAKRSLSRLAALAALLMSSAIAFSAPSTNSIIGNWLGALDTGSAKLRLLFKVGQTYSGVLTAKLDSLDQGARDIAVNAITVKDKAIRLEVKAVQGAYDGTLDESGKKITGTWQQAGHSLPLTLERHEGAVETAAPEKLSTAELAASKKAAQKLAGVWNGTLAAGAASFRLKVRITKTAAGAATGTIESVDQGAKDIPLTDITCKEGVVHFDARGIGAHYDGTLSPGGAMLTGKWHQSGQAMPLEFRKAAVAR
jgi:hypothetical protein